MFHRVGAAAYKANLNNIIALCDKLDHPEKKFVAVHIAGTNGKGSVSSMLAAVLQTAGYRTALFTSPHLKDFRERIRINGIKIPRKEVTEFVDQHRLFFEKIEPSFFEWTTALAFNYFAKEKVEIAVIETGMGGRLDSTNVIDPVLSVITNIGWDHMQFLGNTLKEISAEKAGIIREGVPVIIGEIQDEVAHVFTDTAMERKTTCVFAPFLWSCRVSETAIAGRLVLDIFSGGNLLYKDLELDLAGLYQKKNILTIMQSLRVLNEKGYIISEEHIRQALKNVKKITGIRGRWEILNTNPLVVADTAHNEPGLIAVLSQISELKFKKLHMVIGLVRDKDVDGILELLPEDAVYYFCKADIPRALDAEDIQKAARKFGLSGEKYSTVLEAFDAAKAAAATDDMIFVGGSTFVVAEVIPEFEADPEGIEF
jgi:dihydrofolate synthase/folylpolyglutamate synthase